MCIFPSVLQMYGIWATSLPHFVTLGEVSQKYINALSHEDLYVTNKGSPTYFSEFLDLLENISDKFYENSELEFELLLINGFSFRYKRWFCIS